MSLEKGKNPFTDKELKLLKGKFASIARKHECSTNYVKLIAEGERETSSILGKKILKSLNDLLDILKPEDPKAV